MKDYSSALVAVAIHNDDKHLRSKHSCSVLVYHDTQQG